MKKNCFDFLSSYSLSSCQESDLEKTISIDNKYSLTVPSHLKKKNDLNDILF